MRVPPVLRVIIPLPPILTHPIFLRKCLLRQLHLALILPNLQRQPAARMPRDMAVHDPDAGIVGPERHYHVALCRQESDVAAGRVVVFEGAVGEVVGVEGAVFLG